MGATSASRASRLRALAIAVVAATTWFTAGGPLAGAAKATDGLIAHPYPPNHGASMVSTYGPPIQTIDGFSAAFTVSNLNVATSCGARYGPGGMCSVSGANVRPMQIDAKAPQSAIGQFVGYGYGAGCNGVTGQCAGSTPTTYTERIYYDGIDSQNHYFFSWRDSVQPGTAPLLMLVKYGSAWTLHLDGVFRWTTPLMSMTAGELAAGSESVGGQPLNMNQQYFVNWQQKIVTGSFGGVGAVDYDQPHAPACYSILTTGTGYGTLGRVLGQC